MKRWIVMIMLVTLSTVSAYAQGVSEEPYDDPLDILAVRQFLGDGSFGQRHPDAPVELEQFGRLAGIWITEQELRQMDGSWVTETPGLWVWKYGIDGFAVQDLWYQNEANLPRYMGNLGRDYLLTAMRVFDVRQGKWQVYWLANGGGKSPGEDFGTFTASLEEERLVMSGPPSDFGLQRVIFSDFTEDSFQWQSEFSRDKGETWTAVMRVRAKRHH